MQKTYSLLNHVYQMIHVLLVKNIRQCLFVICSIVISLAMCFAPVATGKMLESGKTTILVGGEIGYPPYSFLDEKGEPTGFQVELTRAIARTMGMNVDIRLTHWPETRKALEDGTIDVIPGMFYSEERAKIYDFSPPFAIVSTAIFARTTSPSVKSIEDLRNKEIIVMRGEAMHDYILKHRLTDRILLTDTPADALRLLASGKGDYALVAQMPGFYWIKELKLSNITSVGPSLEPFKNCFAVKKGNKLLLSRFTEGLSITNQTGEYSKLYEKWLGILEPTRITFRLAVKYAAIVFVPLILLLIGSSLWTWMLRSKVNQKTKELQESEERFRTLSEAAFEAIVIHEEGVLINANDQYFKMFGYEPGEAIGKQMLSITIAPEVREFAAKQVALDRLETYESIGIRKDGTRFPMEVRARKIDYKGRNVRFGAIIDITERKLTEEALRKSEANYRQLFDNSPAAIYQIDFRTGKFVKVNNVICEYFGHSQEEITSISPYDLLTNESKQLFLERLKKMNSGEKVIDNPEFEFVDKNGKRRWLQLNSKNIYDSEGLVGADVVAHDITERKQAEKALRDSEEQLRLLFEKSSDVIYTIGIDYKIISVSPSVEYMLGYKPEEFIGKSVVEITMLAPESLEQALKDVSYVFSGNKVSASEYVFIAKDGSRRLGEVSGAPLTKDGSVTGLISIARDITERKRAEEEKQLLEERLSRAEKMEALGTLAGGVAHDLNNVLGIVVGYAELALDTVDKPSPLRHDLETIMNGGQKAAAIVDDLLTLARRGVSVSNVLNLNRIIADFQKSPELKKLSFHHPAVKIKTDLDSDLLNINGSSVHLSKSLYNLVSNASESMAKGGTLTIKTSKQYLDKPISGYDKIREGEYVVLSVADTGEGISAGDLKRIFEPFYTKKVMGRSGTGLGLAVVWGTVKDHSGYINVQSEEGKGSIFTLYFPLTREEIVAQDDAIAISEYMGKGETILVVDDVKEQRDLASGMLSKLNYNMSSVGSGEDAVEYIKNHKVDLIILDMIMDPGMDGLDTYKSIIKIHPKQKAIIVSGFSESDRVRAAERLGVGAYLKKPYIKEKLGMAVKKELERV